MARERERERENETRDELGHKLSNRARVSMTLICTCTSFFEEVHSGSTI